ncbi:MAG TPA: S49 family peptidase [Sneathiellales bacterium]|nr:S49 family peptidase [Sneathiellales bacterium]
MTALNWCGWRDLIPIKRVRESGPVVAVLRLDGVIGRGAGLGPALSLATAAGRIERAFSMRHAKAVALVVNSPGGSPVQSALIAGRIRALAVEKELPVYAFAEDVAASGGYMLLAAADTLYADPSSIVGSIGVVSSGFGFTELISKLGVERRLHTAGDRKTLLDPFLPESDGDRERLKSIQQELHENFKAYVRGRRQGKLKGPEDELFSGEFWTGTRAMELGLVDDLGDIRAVLREKYGKKVKLRLVTGPRKWWRNRLRPLFPTAIDGGETWADQLVGATERRAIWARFGL